MHLHCRLDCRKFWWCDTSRMDQAHSNHNANTRNHCLEFLTQLADRSSINPSMNQSKHIYTVPHVISRSEEQRLLTYRLPKNQSVTLSNIVNIYESFAQSLNCKKYFECKICNDQSAELARAVFIAPCATCLRLCSKQCQVWEEARLTEGSVIKPQQLTVFSSLWRHETHSTTKNARSMQLRTVLKEQNRTFVAG